MKRQTLWAAKLTVFGLIVLLEVKYFKGKNFKDDICGKNRRNLEDNLDILED